MAGFNGSWGSACGHPVQPGSQFCSVCGQPVGAVEITSGVPQAPGGQPPAPGQPPAGQQPGVGQQSPAGQRPGLGQQSPAGQQPGGQTAHSSPAPPALPSAQSYYAAPTQTQPGFPPPPPESASRRPWPAPNGAPAPPTYPLPTGSESQWVWDESGAPGGRLPSGPTPSPNGGHGHGGTYPTVILESSQGGGTAPPASAPPATVVPGALPPVPGALPPGGSPYGPPATTAASGSGGPQPWPQGPADPHNPYAPPGQNESTATMPGVPPLGPDQWGPGGGWPVNGGPGHPGGTGHRLSGLRLPRPRGPVIPAVAVAAVIVVVAAIIVAFRGSGSGNQTAGNTPPGPTASAPAPQTDSAQQQAAAQLAGLLTQSGGDRGDVVNAVVSVQTCGRGLHTAAGTFTKAARNRRVLVDKLESLPGNSHLPAPMVQHLSTAWQASAQADTDLARWAAAEARDCHKGKTGNNRFLKASYGPDSRATTNKQAFTRQWNPLAQKYSLPTYKWNQL